MKLARSDWEQECLHGGLSSGEGLIHAIRDQIVEQKPVRKGGKIAGYEDVVADPGVADKRAFVLEGEYAAVLKVMSREGNTLSPVLRNAWDGNDLRVMTRNSPLRASSPHISLVGHITREELLRRLDATESANGFGNRFLWIAVKRSKSLPDGGHLSEEHMFSLANSVASAVAYAKEVEEVTRDDTARKLWHELYEQLSEGKPGMFGAMTARSEAHVMRVACLYALLDQSSVVKRVHLKAGLAVWTYAEASVAFVFGDSLGDPVADTILSALRRTPAGLDRTAISRLFSGHRDRARIDSALGVLHSRQLAGSRREQTGGRDREVWFATGAGGTPAKEAA